MRPTLKTLSINAAVVTALVGGAITYVTQNNAVTLSVDGETQEVSTFADTVGDVLAAEGIELGEHDAIAPSLDSTITDGSEISVNYARLLTVTVDGEVQEHWTTARSVEEALADLDIRATGAELSVARSQPIGRDGLDLDVQTVKNVTVLADGKTHEVATTGMTVADALADAKITVGRIDELEPAADTELTPGATITLNRLERQQVVEKDPVAFEKVRENDSDLPAGETKVVTEGKAGVRERTVAKTFRNGELVWSKVLTDEVVTEPVDEVVAVGTKQPEPEPEPEPEPRERSSKKNSSSDDDDSKPIDDGSNGGVWDRLAKCESGGNWSINTGNGYYGGLQFSPSTWRAYGGSGLPHQNSKSEQIRIAEKVRDARGGYGDWPACASKLGLPR